MQYNCRDKCFLVVGTGKSGIAAARLLNSKGAEVIFYDDNDKVSSEEVSAKAGLDRTAALYSGKLPEEVLDRTDAMVLSPGVPVDSEIALQGYAQGCQVMGELELASRFDNGDIMAITGTNGKTTTTALVGDIMKKNRKDVYVAGNIGRPYTETCADTDAASCSVIEVSSFQLETIYEFRPKISAVLNITPDHLNRHHTMENYIAAKMSIAANQTEEDYIVLNYEDEILRNAAEGLKPRVVYFSSRRELDEGVFLRNGKQIIIKFAGCESRLCDIDELQLLGMHNYENVMAAVAMTWMMGVEPEDIHSAVTEFKSVEHRIEFVCEENGVRYYNDSKGTNTDAAIKGIQSMVRPTYLIGGGYNKNADYTDWIQSFDGKVKELVLIGETADLIAKTCVRLGFSNYIKLNTLAEAVYHCRESASEGDAVLLSPACASWDMFNSFEERGKLFKKYVLE